MAISIQELLNKVTAEQVARCERTSDETTGEVFYRVRSESTSAVYDVRFTKGFGFSCTCPAGEEGFAKCSHGTCKHVRWAFVAGQQHKKAERLQALSLSESEAKVAAAAQVTIDGRAATDEELCRIYGSRGGRPTDEELHEMEKYSLSQMNNKPFQFMR